MRRALLPLLALACRPVDLAPEEVDREARDLWRLSMTADDATLLDLVRTLAGRQDLEALEKDAEEGEISRLEPEDVADLAFDGPTPDPAGARGLSWLHAIVCALPDLEEVLTWPDQNEIFRAYDTYQRTFRGGAAARQAFLDGEEDVLTWDGELSASNIAYGSYAYDFVTQIRRLRDADGAPAALLTKNWMVRPADMDSQNKTFTQDYQLEAWVPGEDGRALHFYPFWREMDLGSLGTMESDTVAQTTFFFMGSFDKKIADACQDGLPPP